MLADDPITYAQSQACALSHFLSSKERIKDALRVANAFAVVGKLDLGPIAAAPGLDLNAPRASCIAHRIVSIVQDIEKHLLYLLRIGNQFRQAFIKLFNDLDSVVR